MADLSSHGDIWGTHFNFLKNLNWICLYLINLQIGSNWDKPSSRRLSLYLTLSSMCSLHLFPLTIRTLVGFLFQICAKGNIIIIILVINIFKMSLKTMSAFWLSDVRSFLISISIAVSVLNFGKIFSSATAALAVVTLSLLFAEVSFLRWIPLFESCKRNVYHGFSKPLSLTSASTSLLFRTWYLVTF